MEVNLEQLTLLIDQGKKLSLTQNLVRNKMVLIGKGKILSNQDVEHLKSKIVTTIDVKETEEAIVSPKLKKNLLDEIKQILNEHPYFKDYPAFKRKELGRTIENLFPHSDYLSLALQHIYNFYKPLFEHSVVVSLFSLAVGFAWQRRHNQGLIDSVVLENIFFGALLHDIGYLTLDKNICEAKRKDKLEDKDFRTHPDRGYELLKRDQTKHNFPPNLLNIILQHEERLDQSGFPMEISTNNIIINAQIVGLCDEFEHLLTGNLTDNKRSFTEISRYLMARKTKFNSECINVLIEEFRYLS